MTVVLDRPYQFVPPHRGDWWPSFIQTFRIVDWYLKKAEGVVAYECRGLEHWDASLKRGDAILLAPNHCRYADPLVLGWPARQLGCHVHAMASWHLFAKSKFDAFAIQKMGGFSINRESSDRASLEAAIGILTKAERPLILFPEGTTNRTNDVLKPLLEGVAFIARSAAKRREKESGGQLVMHPVAMKYLCTSGARDWADEQLRQLELHLGWRPLASRSILQRTIRLAEALLSLKEIEYFGGVRSGDLPSRRDGLIEHVLAASESRLAIANENADVRSRVRAIRNAVVSGRFSADTHDISSLQHDAAAADLAQELMSYPDGYLMAADVTDTRIVETIQRMQESFFGRANVEVPLKVVIQCDAPIRVSPDKPPRGQVDPVMSQLENRLTSMIASLSAEARDAISSGLV
ncbi:Acyltransferase [Rubripirellula tenax]|uniref:Acyltransferase n=1 Tax=Rubripirellula tenax TaxID=2528015 RepID=A0A5C6ERU9_9BACT|nr:1-acyl-sn-glycerol-3-phosphate acyltransferase [Rubripirellula tenax]TWU50817.1 Acyltransferase [Rubripirellula tenax]